MKHLIILFSLFFFYTLIDAQETKLHPIQIHDAGASDNDVLTYNNANNSWEPAAAAVGMDNQDLIFRNDSLILENDNTPIYIGTLREDNQALGPFNASTGQLDLEDGGSVNISSKELWTEEVFLIPSSQAFVTVSGTLPANNEGVIVFRNGLQQRIGSDVTISGSSITFAIRILVGGEIIAVKYPI